MSEQELIDWDDINSDLADFSRRHPGEDQIHLRNTFWNNLGGRVLYFDEDHQGNYTIPRKYKRDVPAAPIGERKKTYSYSEGEWSQVIDWDKLQAEWEVFWANSTSKGLADVHDEFWDARGGKELYFDLDGFLQPTKPRTHIRSPLIERKVKTFEVLVAANHVARRNSAVIPWTRFEEKGLRLLLRRVCGASEDKILQFIDELEEGSANSFQGEVGQDGLSYTLIALNKEEESA